MDRKLRKNIQPQKRIFPSKRLDIFFTPICIPYRKMSYLCKSVFTETFIHIFTTQKKKSKK